MRLFVALNLPDNERADLHGSVSPVRESGLPVRWVPASNLHLTLAFLGEVDDQRVGAVGEAVCGEGERHRPLRLELGGFGAFPSFRRPRVLWIGAEGGDPLSALQRGMRTALEPLGFVPDARPFHPHVTVGRVRREGRPGDFRSLGSLAETVTYRRHVEIATVDLMQSLGSSRGVRYLVVASCPLGDAE